MQQQILLIDDLRSIHPLVAALLADEPVAIHSAFDGQYGLVLAASLQPDLILLDVEMPGMDGYETCQRLKADPITARIPVIFLTARAATEEMVRGLDMGANDYVAKPFQLSELLSRVRAALRTSHMMRLLEGTALIDALTGLGNRAMFDKRFAAEVSLRARGGHQLSCIALDVDHFKAIIKKYGYPFAEQVLGKIGNVLTEICRVEDVVCRYGIQEFVIIAPQTSSEDAARVAESMRVAIEKIPFSRQCQSLSVTCSFGTAEAAGSYDRSMLERAQQALRNSKDEGRNRVSIASTQPAFQAKAA